MCDNFSVTMAVGEPFSPPPWTRGLAGTEMGKAWTFREAEDSEVQEGQQQPQRADFQAESASDIPS